MLGKLRYTAMADAILTHPLLAEGLNALFATFTELFRPSSRRRDRRRIQETLHEVERNAIRALDPEMPIPCLSGKGRRDGATSVAHLIALAARVRDDHDNGERPWRRWRGASSPRLVSKISTAGDPSRS